MCLSTSKHILDGQMGSQEEKKEASNTFVLCALRTQPIAGLMSFHSNHLHSLHTSLSLVLTHSLRWLPREKRGSEK
jgi:hypothetical protein